MPLLCLGIPLEYIDIMFFAKQYIRANDIISVLDVKYHTKDGNEETIPGARETQELVVKLEQDGAYTGFLPDLLRRKERDDPEFLTKFVHFVTGSSFVPHDSKYKIIVEFNFDESTSSEWLAVSHTCVNTLRLPGFA